MVKLILMIYFHIMLNIKMKSKMIINIVIKYVIFVNKNIKLINGNKYVFIIEKVSSLKQNIYLYMYIAY